MTFEIEIEGRPRTVSVEPLSTSGADGGRFRVTVQDAVSSGAVSVREAVTWEIDARRTDLGLSLLYLADGRVVDAAVTDLPRGEALVQLPHVDVRVGIDGRRFRRADAAGGRSGEQRITAPMPGRVLRVLVAPGEEVRAQQGLVVVEAMKMENELSAARPGRVREVAVAPGTSVEAGCLLVLIE